MASLRSAVANERFFSPNQPCVLQVSKPWPFNVVLAPRCAEGDLGAYLVFPSYLGLR